MKYELSTLAFDLFKSLSQKKKKLSGKLQSLSSEKGSKKTNKK